MPFRRVVPLLAVEISRLGARDLKLEGFEAGDIHGIEIHEVDIDGIGALLLARVGQGGFSKRVIGGAEIEVDFRAWCYGGEKGGIESQGLTSIETDCDSRDSGGRGARADCGCSRCSGCESGRGDTSQISVLGLGVGDELIHLGLRAGVETEDHACAAMVGRTLLFAVEPLRGGAVYGEGDDEQIGDVLGVNLV